MLVVEDVSRVFPVRSREGLRMLFAVSKASFSLEKGECVGLVGESTSGQVLFDGEPLPLACASSPAVGRIQMVFQDAFSSLDPRLSVGRTVAEGLESRGFQRRRKMGRAEIRDAVRDMFAKVGLAGMEKRFPHEFSGGQRQRVALARALVTRPDLVVCDEPVSALDASVQAQVLNVMRDLQEEFGQAQLFISHNLAVVGYMCSRVLVMYLGRIVEMLEAKDLGRAAHPYTRALYRAMPGRTRAGEELVVLEGELPSPLNPPQGCHFHPRCPKAQDICKEKAPDWKELAPGWRVRCHFAE